MNKRLCVLLIVLFGVNTSLPKVALATKTEKRRKPTAASIIAYALGDVRRMRSEMLKDEMWVDSVWMKVKYVQVTFGNKDYIYNGKHQLIQTRRSKYSTAGFVGDYAEVDWELLDKKKKTYSDVFGLKVIKRKGNGWVRVAGFGTADGYGDQLKKAKVPAWIIKRIDRPIEITNK